MLFCLQLVDFAGVSPFLAWVWRYLCQSARDLCVLEAIEPPTGTWLSLNCLTFSMHGLVNSRLAGGDVDGDLNMAAFLHL